MSSAVGTIAKSCFLRGGAGESFERCLYEVVNRCGWKLHAYVIMSNHYHLAVETPEPNLVFGMKWLQSTFATRFNRLRNERGHVFQGRYKAILIGEDRPLLGLVVKALAAASKSEADTQSELKGAPWKAGIARTLRAQTTAGNLWIAKRLNMGHPSRVTNLIRELSMNE